MTPAAMSPVPVPPEHAGIREKLDWTGLQQYVKLIGGWGKEEARNAVLQYLHLYPTDPQTMAQATAHAELVRDRIRCGR